MNFLRPFAVLLALTSSTALAAEAPFYVGTYTRPGASKGIYRGVLNVETGKISALQLVAETTNPSFLAIHPTGKFLYAATEGSSGEAEAYAVAADGGLKFLNRQSAKGNGTCHIVVDAAGKNVLVANYGSGNVAVLPIQPDGSLGAATGSHQHTGSSVNPGRQKQPHAHAIYADAASKYVYSCDLGTDRIDGYKFDATKGTITLDETASAKVPPGSGPRHLALHPQQDTVYVINELLSSISGFRRDPSTGALSLIETVPTLPAGFTGQNSTAEIFVHPNGRTLYGSNRGHDSIVAFAISSDGQLALAGHTPAGVKTPRGFAIDPSGKWLLTAGQDSNDLAVLQIDTGGKLAPTAQHAEVGAPVCIMFLPPAGK